MRAEKTLSYLQEAVRRLLKQGKFVHHAEKFKFRPSQRLSLKAYAEHLANESLSVQDRLLGFFVLPTGTGKTPLFIAIITEAQEVAAEKGDTLKAAIVVPTRKLLSQTYDEIAEYASAKAAADIGRYGDGHRQTGHDMNIYTYHAWVNLTREGKLGSHNVDILLNDEAHRGTSDTRAEEIFAKYEDNGTACLAFTATYKFDDDKSVEKTHKHKIIEREIGQCVQGGELVPYIATQFYVIRVMPPEEYPEGVDEGKYNQFLMKKAWIQRMVVVAREGCDAVTGDPLYDNQMAFYCKDTSVADAMAAALNEDPSLKVVVENIGGDGVAVSVHSNLRPLRLAAERLQSMEEGQHLAVTGDNMLIEGYNYPPLKTILDGSHGSLVEKAQIIGRGTRRWENEAKGGRLEGLTFVDSIVYMGDEDPEIDARNKNTARRNAVTAIDVLGATYVLGPNAKMPKTQKGNGKATGGMGLPLTDIEGQEVDAYITLEETLVFEGEVRNARENNFRLLSDEEMEITQPLRDKLIQDISSHNLTVHILESFTDKRVPWHRIHSWISIVGEKKKSGLPQYGASTCLRTEWEDVQRALTQASEQGVKSIGIRNKPKDTALTLEMLKNLESEIERTGCGSYKLVKHHGLPKKLESKIESWRRFGNPDNKRGYAKTCDINEWDMVISLLQSLPTSLSRSMRGLSRKRDINDIDIKER